MVWFCDCNCACGLCEGGDCECECHDLDILSDDQLVSLIVKHTSKTRKELRHLSRNHLYKTIRHTEPEKILKAGYSIVGQLLGDADADDALPDLSIKQINEIAERATPSKQPKTIRNTPSPKKTIKKPVKAKEPTKKPAKKPTNKPAKKPSKKKPVKSTAAKKAAKARALARCQT